MPVDAAALQEAVRGEGLDGWLFCGFHHRDPLADEILGRDPGSTNSRLWIYAVPAAGSPVKIVHAVEPGALADLPGDSRRYRGRDELTAALAPLAGRRWGAHWSENITAVSFLDAGTARVLERAGLVLADASALIQRFRGLLDEAGMASHERAAVCLYEIVNAAWGMVRRAWASGRPVTEGGVRALMLAEMDRRGLVTDHPPIVAAGINASDCHYDFTGPGRTFVEGDVVQFDLWAKEKTPGAIYADISWAGFFGRGPVPAALQHCFEAVLRAREAALALIAEETAGKRRLSGARVDEAAREVLTRLNLGHGLRHRTGHGIDREVHGSGVNMDAVEFPDHRAVLDGSCFSLEPGLYFDDWGMRTEIDVYIRDGRPVVSGRPYSRQFELLRCL